MVNGTLTKRGRERRRRTWTRSPGKQGGSARFSGCGRAKRSQLSVGRKGFRGAGCTSRDCGTRGRRPLVARRLAVPAGASEPGPGRDRGDRPTHPAGVVNRAQFCGAQAMRWRLADLAVHPLPSVRTIGRILVRHELTVRLRRVFLGDPFVPPPTPHSIQPTGNATPSRPLPSGSIPPRDASGVVTPKLQYSHQ